MAELAGSHPQVFVVARQCQFTALDVHSGVTDMVARMILVRCL